MLKTIWFKTRALANYYKWYLLSKNNNIYIELGSGPRKGKGGWTTIDMHGADIIHDLRSGIPLADQSVEKIYSSHFLEHIPHNEILEFLRECHRVLRNDGEFSLCVPDARKYIDAYINRKIFKPYNMMYQPYKINTGSFLDQVNYIAYMGYEHMHLFDSENIKNILLMAGFRDVTTREYDASIDLIDRDYESLYCKALK